MKIIIYSEGNTGTKSLSQALKDINIEHYYSHRITHMRTTRSHVFEEILEPNSKWKVLTLVRNPIDWSISLLARRINQGNTTKVKLNYENYKHLLSWFEDNFQPLFDIDIYSCYNNIRDHGFQFCHSDKVDSLIIKTEFLNSFETTIARFLQVPKIKIPHINKWKSQFKETLNYKPSESFIQKMQDSRYWRYFYA